MVNAAVGRHMSSVEDYRERLATLQGAWDTLSLLSHLSGDGADMTGTRQAFEALAADLVRSLGEETYKKSLLALKAKGQIAIDVLVRNLYERTADIGFLATDDDIRQYLRDRRAAQSAENAAARSAELNGQLVRRFREYVAKYSVYHDVVLLNPDGEVLARLQEHKDVVRTQHALLAQTLATRAGYIESFGKIDLLPEQDRSLVYSFRVCEGAQTVGVLCLCFRFADEVAGIFAKLREENDWTVFCFLDERGNVLASNDPWQAPIGAPLPLALEEGGRVIRFAGREYLAITRRTQGYQGYLGPGWYGHAMLPIEHAFDRRAADASTAVSQQMLANLSDSQAIFSEALRRIPPQADQIQRELNRAVWNGNVRLAARAESNNFAKVLLWEIGNAGRRTQETFQHSIKDLQETVISAILKDAQLLASLAVDVLDRNLYERANDCRWWALNATLTNYLADPTVGAEQVTAILRHINGLYTVYHGIVLFDGAGRIVAASQAAHDRWIGKSLSEEWVGRTLALRDSQHFAVSNFGPSALYGGRHTLIYGAALRNDAGRTLGGIGIVFDSTPQLRAMLSDALPRTESGAVASGCIGLFVDDDMRVIAATAKFEPGETVELPRELLQSAERSVAQVVTRDGMCYAIGARRTTGYREYRGMGAAAVLMIPLGEIKEQTTMASRTHRQSMQRRAGSNEAVIDIATFFSANHWLGLARDEVIEALDATQIRPIPNSPPWHVGLFMYRNAPIPVVDVARLLDGPNARRGRNLIVARAVGDTQLIGLLVDELAEIPEVPAERILPLAELTQRSGPAILNRAVRPEHADDPVLFVVSVEQLLVYTYLSRPTPAAAKATPALRVAK
jgi:chemotaxis signal transduction protein